MSKTVKCPNCKSTNVIVVQGYALAVQYQCKVCRESFVREVKR